MTANLARDLSHCGLAIYIKRYLKTKEELWKFKNSTMQKYNLKKSSKKTQNPSRYYNSNVISSFNTSQNIIFQKSSYKTRFLT